MQQQVPADRGQRRTSPFRYGVGMFGTSIPINLIKGSMLYFYVELLGMDATVFAGVYAIYGILDAIDNPVFGYLSDRTRSRWGRRKPYLVVGSLVLLGAMIALFSVPGSVAASATSLVIWFAVFAILSEMADSLINANYGALLPELFPANVRYTGSAVAYNLSSVIGSAPASFVAIALWQAAGGSTWLVGLYMAAAAVLTFIALWITRETKDTDYENNVA